MLLLRSQKGVTLIEIIASLTILSIIFVSILHFFPQMGLMNKRNEEKIQGINTAKRVMVKWKESKAVQNFIGGFVDGSPEDLSKLEVSYDYASNIDKDGDGDIDALLYSSTNDDYKIEIEILTSSDLDSTHFTSKANQIYVKVLNHKGRLLSESYGYVIKGDETTE